MRSVDPVESFVEGVLIPTGWGPGGEVLDVGLMTFDEHELRIAPPAVAAHGLRRYLRKHVRLAAIIRDDRVVELRGFEVLGASEARFAPGSFVPPSR